MRLSVSPGFLLFAAALLYFDRQNLLLWLLPGCAVHELAHWAALRLSGCGVAALRLTISGAAMELRRPEVLSYPGELAAALSGPAANLFLALAAAWLGRRLNLPDFFLFSGLNFGLAVFHFLPARTLDGGRALFLLLSWLFSPGWAEAVLRVTSLLTAAFLTGLGVYALRRGGGFPLLTTGLWLLAQALPQRKGLVNGRVSV